MTQTMTVYSAQGDAYEIEHDGTVGSIYHACLLYTSPSPRD